MEPNQRSVVEDVLKLIDERMPMGLGDDPLRQIAYLATVTDMILSHTRSKINNRQVIHNESVRIHNLPMEILNEILGVQVQQMAVGDRQDTMATLSLVCRRWRDIINDCRILWTVLHSSNTPDFTRNALTRSGNLPVKLVLEGYGGRSHADGSLLAFAYRIQSLDYRGWNVAVAENYALYAVHLRIVFSEELDDLDDGGNYLVPGEDDVIQSALSIPAGPPLQSLYIDGVSIISCEWGRMNQLESLNLSDIIGNSPSFFSHLLEAITASFDLRNLEIENVEGGDEDDTIVSFPSSVIHLPRIGRLKLLQDSFFTSSLWPRLSVPQCSSLELIGHGLDSLTWDWFSRNFGQAIRLANEVSITLRLSESNSTVNINSRISWYLGVYWDPMPVISRLVQLFGEVGFRRNVPLSLYVVDSYTIIPEPFDLPISVLEGLGDLVHLEATGHVDLSPLMKSLETIQEGRSNWSCPNLRCIRFDRRSEPRHRAFFLPDHSRWETFVDEDSYYTTTLIPLHAPLFFGNT